MSITFIEVWDKLTISEKTELAHALKISVPVLAVTRVNRLKALQLSTRCMCSICEAAKKIQANCPTERMLMS